METKLTAVEWLTNYMKVNFHLTDESLEVFDAAKAIEKEQIKDAFINYFVNDDTNLNDKRALYKISEQYYNETYGTPR